MDIAPSPPPSFSTGRPRVSPDDRALWQAAQKLEASFLSEMLKSAGLDQGPGGFGGGAGEEQFASFLREAQAGLMVKAGGIGLTQPLFEALKERDDGPV